jgi:hypothetical protein
MSSKNKNSVATLFFISFLVSVPSSHMFEHLVKVLDIFTLSHLALLLARPFWVGYRSSSVFGLVDEG